MNLNAYFESRDIGEVAVLTRKILLMGYAGSGKSSVCRILESPKYSMKCCRASIYCSRHIAFPQLAEKYGYQNELECWRDRNNHREEWFTLIRKYNRSYPARFGNRIWSQNTVYSGLRDVHEYQVLNARKMFDFAIWVDAFPRIPNENESSITVGPLHAQYVIPNFASEKLLPRTVALLVEQLGLKGDSETW